MKSILDPTFKYVPAVSTDLRKTFARERKRQAEKASAAAAAAAAPVARLRKVC